MQIEDANLPKNPQISAENSHFPEKIAKNSENKVCQNDSTFNVKNDSCNVINDTNINNDNFINDSYGILNISNVNNDNPNVTEITDGCVSTVINDTQDGSSDDKLPTNLNGASNVKAKTDSCVSTVVNDILEDSSDDELSSNLNVNSNVKAKTDSCVSTVINDTHDDSSNDELSSNLNVNSNVKAKTDSCVSTLIKETHDDSSDDELSTNLNGNSTVKAKTDSCVSSVINDTHDDSSDDALSSNLRKQRLSASDDDSAGRIVPRKKMTRLIDSDSDEEASIGARDDDGDCVVGSRTEEPIYGEANKKSRLSALCDSDSSEEEDNTSQDDIRLETFEKSKHRKKQEPLAEKPKKMTNKEAMEQRKEIESESQRMLRERQVSLPYHKPKQRTLREFLSKRSRFASALPVETVKDPPAIAIKMSSQHLEVITKRLQQREKEAEEFFKSDSEVSDDEAVEETSEDKDEELEAKGPEEDIKQNTEIVDARQEKTEVEEGNLKNKVEVEKENLKDKVEVGNLENKIEVAKRSLKNKAEVAEGNLKNQVEVEEGNLKDKIEVKEGNSKDKIEVGTSEVSDIETQISPQNEYSTLSEPQTEPSEPQTEASEPQTEPTEPQTEPAETQTESSELQTEPSEPQTEPTEPQTEPSEPQTDMDYSFNLNDSGEQLEPQSSDSPQDLQPQTSQDPEPQMTAPRELEISEAAQESEISEPPQNPQLSRKAKLLESLKDTTPKLSGGPNLLIDLERGITKPDKVTELMQRFAQHTSKRKTPQQNKIQVSIVSVSGGGEIHKEQLAVKVMDKEAPPISDKPGLMLQKLKSELESQMALRRTELWRQKQNHIKSTVEDEEMSTFNGEKETCGSDEDDILDNEDEEDLTESEEEMDEDEEEVEEEKTKCFAEEEAEEENDGDEDENDVDEDEELSEDEDQSEDDSSCQSNVKAKQLKRIIKPCEDDSDEEAQKDTRLPNDDFETDTDDDDCPPAGQSRNHRTPKRDQQASKSDLSFLTPVCHLTGLQAPGGVDESFLQQGSPTPEQIVPPDEPSPLKGNWQKKLFADTDIIPTQHTVVDDLSENCLGVFVYQTTEVTDDALKSPVKLPEDEAPSTQELMDLCSGKFSAVDSTQQELSNVTVENVTLGQSEIKNFDSDNDDKFISQLIDEQEMEEFKKKFESPVKTCQLPANSGSPAKITFQSSDEDEEVETVLQKKKKRNAIVDSDEESEGEEPEETIDLHDQDDEEEVLKEVDYDSEENEIELVDKQTDGKGKKLKASDFFEEEAELSESEWGSEDEDEGGLDILDTEQGDSEKFDEDKVRTEIEKLHMRQILDDDNREVKILQELLLEDGELHGAGRQRQFRWKNIDSQMNVSEGANVEDGENQLVEEEDEEDELEWRRKRHERELFLRKNSQGSQETVPVDCDLTLSTDSQVIKLGQKAIIRNNSQPGNVEPVKSVINVKQSFSLLNKRGSFLSRTDKVLARVAEFTKIQETTVGGAKNSRNFVFQSVNPSDASTSLDKKRKAQADGTPLAIKKIRLNTLSPALQKKTEKNMKKKLFGGGAGW